MVKKNSFLWFVFILLFISGVITSAIGIFGIISPSYQYMNKYEFAEMELNGKEVSDEELSERFDFYLSIRKEYVDNNNRITAVVGGCLIFLSIVLFLLDRHRMKNLTTMELKTYKDYKYTDIDGKIYQENEISKINSENIKDVTKALSNVETRIKDSDLKVVADLLKNYNK